MKTCSKCGVPKPAGEFHKASGRKDGLQPMCKDCNRKTRNAYYRKNPEATKLYYYGRQQKLREIVRAYLEEHPCIDCGNSNIIVLDFDHVREEKIASISYMVNQAVKVETLLREIEKCEVRCANCHRIITHKRRLATLR